MFSVLSTLSPGLLSKEQKNQLGPALANSTCYEQRVHPGRSLERFEEFGQVLLRKWGLSPTLALHVFLLATLLILKFRGKTMWSFFSDEEKRTLSLMQPAKPHCSELLSVL